MLALVEVLMAVLNWHHLTCAAAAPTLDPRPVLLGRSLCRPDPAARDQQTGGGNGENRAGPAPQDDSYLESYGLSVEILMLVAFLRHSWMPPEDASVRGIQAAIPRGERCGARQHATRGHAPQATRPPHVQFRALLAMATHPFHPHKADLGTSSPYDWTAAGEEDLGQLARKSRPPELISPQTTDQTDQRAGEGCERRSDRSSLLCWPASPWGAQGAQGASTERGWVCMAKYR